MILGQDREAVIENIRGAAESGDFYAKVELHDPVLTEAQSRAVIDRYMVDRRRFSFRVKTAVAMGFADLAGAVINRDTCTVGAEAIPPIPGGVILTSNHFGPLENTVIRRYAKQYLKKKVRVVSQVTNFAMPGAIGFLMNYAGTIPLAGDLRYLEGDFLSVLEERMRAGEGVLIYPEQEMWFNYRKPRPPKRGAYHFAAKLQVPVLSCFVEIRDTDKADTEEFCKVQYILHVLGLLWPDPQKTVRTNSIELAEKDYAMKKAAYEAAYGKPLDYRFSPEDIAGWTGGRNG